MNPLRRYWFTFSQSSQPTPLSIGCGVTAYNYDDSLDLLRDRVFGGLQPTLANVIADVDVSTLDKGHVLPNMGSTVVRGVWFPMGYDTTSCQTARSM